MAPSFGILKTTALKSLGITNNLCSCLTAHTAFGSVGVFKGFDRHQESNMKTLLPVAVIGLFGLSLANVAYADEATASAKSSETTEPSGTAEANLEAKMASMRVLQNHL